MNVRARDLALEIFEPSDLSLIRLFKREGGEWVEPPPANRNGRCDPPVLHQNDYALLYTADRIETIAIECSILSVDRQNRWTYDEAMTRDYSVARYQFTRPAVFIPMDRNRSLLDIDSEPFVPGYSNWQNAAHRLWRRFGQTVHGLSWWSMHRHQVGRVYAIWHQHKTTIGMRRPTGPFQKLCDDSDWKSLLDANPAFTALTNPLCSTPTSPPTP